MTKQAMATALWSTVLLTILAAPTARAEGLDLIGRIAHVTSAQTAVTVTHLGISHPAQPLVHLYSGDVITVPDGAEVEIEVDATPRVVTHKDSPLTVSSPSSGWFSLADNALLATFPVALDGLNRTIDEAALARLDGAGSQPPTPDPLVAQSAQLTLSGARSLAVMWRGQSTKVTAWFADGRKAAAEQPSGGFAAVLTLPASAGESDLWIRLADGGEAWTIKHAGAPPDPPWFGSAGAASDERRLARAVWILEAGPLDWRLFALTEIHELSDHNQIAHELWEHANSGDLAALIQAMAGQAPR